MPVLALTPNAALAAGLSTEERDTLVGAARPVTLSSGESLFRLGDDARDLYVVKSGLIELTLHVPVAGSDSRVVVEEAAPGETLGWSALVAPHKYTLDASAAVDSTLLAWSRDELHGICQAHPDVGYSLLNNLLTTVGSRLHVLYAMWARELRRNLERDYPAGEVR